MSTPSTALISALRQVLHPLIRLMLSRGMTYPALLEMLKGIFVDVALLELQAKSTKRTDSSVSLMTGVHRKDVRRLRGQDVSEPATPTSLGAQVVALWSGLPEFTDESGRPKPLARFASQAGAQSFDALAVRINTDIRPRSILDELLRLGIVEIDSEDRVVLLSNAFVPQQGSEEKLGYFGHNVHDHAAAAVDNVLGGSAPWLERSVYYSGLAPEAVSELHTLASETGMQAIQAVNRKAIAFEEQQGTQSGPQQRFTFGVYFYAEPAEPMPTAPDEPAP
jgi:uncharacterized protein DUF6502